LTLDPIRPFQQRRDAHSNASNGSRPRPRLLGKLAGADRLRTGVSQAGSGGSRRRLESEPDQDCGLCPAHQQSSMGGCSRQRSPHGAGYRTSERFRCERLSGRDSRPGFARPPSRKALQATARLDSWRHRHRSWPLISQRRKQGQLFYFPLTPHACFI